MSSKGDKLAKRVAKLEAKNATGVALTCANLKVTIWRKRKSNAQLVMEVSDAKFKSDDSMRKARRFVKACVYVLFSVQFHADVNKKIVNGRDGMLARMKQMERRLERLN